MENKIYVIVLDCYSDNEQYSEVINTAYKNRGECVKGLETAINDELECLGEGFYIQNGDTIVREDDYELITRYNIHELEVK